MQMRIIKTFAFLTAFSLGLTLLAGCDALMGIENLAGTVTAVNNADRTIDVRDAKGKTKEIRISRDARIFTDGKKAGFSALKRGRQVIVKFTRPDGKINVKTILVTARN